MTGFPAIVGGDVQTANGGVGNTHSAVLVGGDASEGKMASEMPNVCSKLIFKM